MQAASPSQPARQRSQSLNPTFKAKHAEHAELAFESSSWQLQGLVADARSAPDDIPNMAWHRRTSSGSNLYITEDRLPELQSSVGNSNKYSRHSSSSSSSQGDARSTAQLLTNDRPGSGDWLSSSSSSDDNVAPLRSISLPESMVAGLLQREFGAMPPARRDASLPAGFRTSLPALPAMLERQTTPVLTLRQRYGSRHDLLELDEGDNLEGSVSAGGSLSLSDESDSADSELQIGSDDIHLQLASGEEDQTVLPEQVTALIEVALHADLLRVGLSICHAPGGVLCEAC